MRYAALVLLLALTAACGSEPASKDSSPEPTAAPSATTSARAAAAPRIIRYGDPGIELKTPDDVDLLEGIPDSFTAFLRTQLSTDDPDCDLPRTIHVAAVDTRGLAVGEFNECGGAIVVWGDDDQGWRELFGTQGPGTPCPADLAGFTPADVEELAGGALCEPGARQTTGHVVTRGNFRLGQTAHFRYFDVTVHEHRFADNGIEGGGIYGARVSVCYTHKHPDPRADGSTRSSRDPWRFGWAHGPDPVWDRGAGRPSDRWQPAYREKNLKVGECNTGWLTTEFRETVYVAHIGMRYQPANFDFRGTWTW